MFDRIKSLICRIRKHDPRKYSPTDWISSISIKGDLSPYESLLPVSNYSDDEPWVRFDNVKMERSLSSYIAYDTYPIPSTSDREGYHGSRHYDYWLILQPHFVILRSEATLYCRSGQCEESRFAGVKLQCSNEILRSLRSLRMTFRATAVVVLGYYRFGMRYGLPLLPFLLLFIAATIWELARRWQLGASVVAGLVVATFLAFWPNMRLLPNPWLNLPREELRPVVAYVHQQAQPGDFIYVYYGAVPAYQVYQPELTYPTELGTWFRDWPLVEKLSEIRRAVGDAPRFWLVMSHIHPSEDSALIDGLTKATPSYHLVDEYRTKNAATVLLQRDEL